jgi:uncharacterized protein YcbK (DUF882 family)
MVAAAVLAGAPLPVFPASRDFWTRPRELWLIRASTGEQGRILYWEEGDYRPDGYRALCWMLRDDHANLAARMDPVLFNLVYGIQEWLKDWGIDRPLIVRSGYRTPATNAHIEGAARDSQHVEGRALDFAVAGIPRSGQHGRESWRVQVPLPSIARFGRLAYPLLGEETDRDMRGRKSHGCPT